MSENIYADMSRQMRESFNKAKDEALKEVRRKVWLIDGIVEEMRKNWEIANADKYEAVEAIYWDKVKAIEEQAKALLQLRKEAEAEREAARMDLHQESSEAVRDIAETYKAEREELVSQWRSIEAEITAKYRARLEAKQSKSA